MAIHSLEVAGKEGYILRLWSLALCVLVCVAPTVTATQTVTIGTPDGPLTCYIYASEYIPSTRIVILGHGGETFEIAASQASFVGHGWGGPLQSRVEGISMESLCSLLYEHCRFELTINGTRISPSCMVVWSHESTVAGAEGQLDWAVRYHFEFPAGFFKPGVYLLTGEWQLVNYPCAWTVEGWCDSLGDSGWTSVDGAASYTGSRVPLTLSVVSP